MGESLNKINVAELKKEYRNKWWRMSNSLEVPLKESSYLKKKNTEKKFEKLVDEVIEHINSFPEAIEKREQWKSEGQKKLEKSIQGFEGFELGSVDEKMKMQFIDTTKEFIRECKKFDKDISYGDIGQAMRNVWIISILQKTFGKDIKFSMASFGYSMLYPYSDNYLDNPEITIEEKKKFNERFYRRLLGEELRPNSEHENQIFQLIERIEQVYDRRSFEKVYESLLIIFEGQRKSLIQQEGISNPYEKDMLDISIEKGGASVIADGYLIEGDLTAEEENFSFGYGFLLQLCDDLQDVKEDKENNHMTVMSQLAGRYELDNIVTKLINLTIEVVKEANCFRCENEELVKKLIIDNCVLMIIFAAAMAKEYFSKNYIKEIEKYLPFTMGYIEKLKSRMRSKFKSIERTYYDLDIEEVVYYLLS